MYLLIDFCSFSERAKKAQAASQLYRMKLKNFHAAMVLERASELKYEQLDLAPFPSQAAL